MCQAHSSDSGLPLRSGSGRYYVWTVGCQMNFADSRRLSELLEGRGYCEAATADEADLVVLNTCVVRQSAEERVLGRLSALKGLKEQRPEVRLAVMGCLVGVEPEGPLSLGERFPYVDFWLPPSAHERLLDHLDAIGPAATLPSPVSRYVTIMTGCNNFCSYCIVPYRRGREQSRPPTDIRREMEDLAAHGAREITLLGQNVDSYGRGLLGEPTLADLLHQVHDVDGIERLRFLTNHPKDLSDGLIRAVASLRKVCEHIELPLQSGSNEVLRRMNRRYTREQYLDLVERIRAEIPGVSLATDVIVGYPGETHEQFLQTLTLLDQVGYTAIHIACYSPREGTAAARLPDDVPEAVKDERRRAVEEVLERHSAALNRAFLGQRVEVLFEERTRGKWRGRTRTNRLVFVDNNADLRGRLLPVEITWTGPWSMQARLAENEGV